MRNIFALVTFSSFVFVQARALQIHIISSTENKDGSAVIVNACNDGLMSTLVCNADQPDCTVLPPGWYKMENLSADDSKAKYQGRNVEIYDYHTRDYRVFGVRAIQERDSCPY